ncbi:LysE family translocator [Corynebacterium aquatimens]|uniref:LysE family translocator n=1 Tax=Corynebacterium TaxID=1716 RepID=UPI001F175CDC|nr:MULTISPECIES: LysE family translocator [Corynebacterium]QYH18959.1 LysE family translocator [Corynebacterium aquatimens]UIZ92208.1 LysE family translocator [Corynebacterium sp. CNCTC7651]
MTLSLFATLLVAWFAGIMSPGPDLFQIIRVGAKDRAAGVACAAGIMLGNTVWIVASLLGLSALVQAVPEILTVLQVVGGSYLLYMGVGALRGGLAARRVPAGQVAGAAAGASAMEGAAGPDAGLNAADIPAPPRVLTPARAFGLGVATNLANPKALLFFGAIFAQFVRPGMGWGWMVAIAVTLIITGIAWFVGFAIAVRALAKPIQRYSWAIDAFAGVVFIAIALWMLVEGIQGISALLG